jgi:hypothetical protein
MSKAKKPIQIDEGLLERCLAAGGEVWRDKQNRIIAIKVPERGLAPDDKKRWADIGQQSSELSRSQGWRDTEPPNPANLLGREVYWASPKITEAQLATSIRQAKYTHAKSRVEQLTRHPQMRAEVELLRGRLPAEEGDISSDPFWHDLAQAEMLALAYDVEKPVIRDRRRQAGARLGGKSGGQVKKAAAAPWKADVIETAQKLLAAGKSPRNLASILSARFGKSTRAIRDVLRKAEIK